MGSGPPASTPEDSGPCLDGVVSVSAAAPANPVADLYAHHHGWLYGWLRRKLGCADNAADLAQDTFIRILATRDQLFAGGRPLVQPRAYLTTVAKNLLVDRARRQALEQAYLAELALVQDTLGGHPSPEDILLTVQALAQIGEALEGLSERVREAFLLHYLEGLGHAAIAEHLGVSDRMVRKYLVQALVHCQQVRDGA
jgi:RNA polymerase sigma-70 factor (ECF subfamily)